MSADPEPEPDPELGSARVPGPVTVEVNDSTEAGVGQLDRWSAVARETLRGEDVSAGRLDLIFVDEDEIATLNRDHLGGDGPTDVLAFPIDGPDTGSAEMAVTGEGDPFIHLGDVVICPTVARSQAPDHCGTYDAEMALLIVHGVLHVLGHDHAVPAETEAMQDRERHHLDRYGFTHPVPA